MLLEPMDDSAEAPAQSIALFNLMAGRRSWHQLSTTSQVRGEGKLTGMATDLMILCLCAESRDGCSITTSMFPTTFILRALIDPFSGGGSIQPNADT